MSRLQYRNAYFDTKNGQIEIFQNKPKWAFSLRLEGSFRDGYITEFCNRKGVKMVKYTFSLGYNYLDNAILRGREHLRLYLEEKRKSTMPTRGFSS